jgi:uncharacterized protein (DUF58 family)
VRHAEPTSDNLPTPLLSPEFLRKLEQAAIASRHILVGRTKGERRSARRGSSVEFADYRSYSHGDDLRYVDWNAFARLDRMFLKLFVEEEDLHVYVLVDASRSMDFGSPSKLEWARQAAAALGYMSLCSGDRAQLFSHSAEAREASRMFRGRGSTPEMFRWIRGIEAAGETDLQQAVRWVQNVAPAPGMLFVLSDLLTPDWQAALSRLGAGKGDCCVVQVFSPSEFEPDARGDVQLIDSETRQTVEMTMSPSVLRRYREGRDEFLHGVRTTAHRYGFSHLLAVTDEAVEDTILKSLRRLRVVK